MTSYDHALLSASSAHRWLRCTPSARLETQFPDTESESAAEGTLAHAMAAARLEGFILTGQWPKTAPAFKDAPLYRPAMEGYVQDYCLFVIETLERLKQKDPFTTIYVEQRISYDAFVPEGFGTADCLIIGDGELHIIDFKYGKGVRVEAEENPQMRLYALGAVKKFPLAEMDVAHMTIFQPRIDNISTEVLSVNALLDWGVNHVQQRAAAAYKGEGEFVPGEWCRFCRAEATCAARAKHQLELAKYDFREAALLTSEEIGDILARVDDLTHWAKSVKDYALDRAVNHGEAFAGWKLVAGRANRRITDPAAALSRLESAGYSYDQVVDLVGLTKLEDIVGRKHLQDLIGDLIEKPAGKPTLARDTDKRPAYSAAAEDFKE